MSLKQKKQIIEQMKYVADKVDKKDTENKRFIVGMAALGMVVVARTVAVLGAVLGGNTQVEIED